MGRRAFASVSLAVLTACSAPRGGSPGVPVVRGDDVADLMTARDRSRVESIARERLAGDERDGYRIGPDDLLDVRIPDLLDQHAREVPGGNRGIALPVVTEAPVFERGVRVSSRGDIALPWLGTVRAEGFTAPELEADLSRRLVAARLLRQPQPSVHVIEYRSGVVAVMGSVERPGLYPVTRPGATIADLVWAAGGPSKEAGRVVAFSPGKAAEPIRLDLELLISPDAQLDRHLNPRVRPGDVVSIAPAGSVQVDGWVDKPGSYPVTRGLTLTGAVAAAGGAHFAADREHATVRRTMGPKDQEHFTVDLQAIERGDAPDLPLADGDVVHLPASTTRVVPWGLYEAGTRIINIGGNVLLF